MGLAKAIFVVSVVGIAGTGLGGVIVACIGNPSKRILSFLLGFAGGIMVSVVAFDLMPEAFETGGTWVSLIGFFAGCVATMAIDLVLPHVHRFTCENEADSRMARTACMVFLGIALHNIPEGLAVGAGLAAGERIGLQIALVIMLHNIPEGIAVGGPLKAIGKSNINIVAVAAQAGLPTVVGGIIGALIGGVSPAFLAASMAFAGGAMLFITFDELIPNCHLLGLGRSGTIGAVAGVMVNIVLSRVFYV